MRWEDVVILFCYVFRKRGKRAKTAKKKSPKQSVNEKLDALLDKLPAFLDNANKAAAAHQKALVKFERKQGLVDSDDTSSED